MTLERATARARGTPAGPLVAEIVGGARPGSGLRGLAARMEAVGGTLSVESPPGCGTRVRAHAPRATAAAQDAA